MKTTMIGAVLAGLLFQAGCTSMTPTERSTAIGTGIGAAVGAVLGNNLGNSQNDRELSIAAGALLGGVVGHQYGRQGELQRQVSTVQQQQFMTTIWIENSNNSKTPVVLRQTEGGQYIGPRGEYYTTLPTQDQLKSVYGV